MIQESTDLCAAHIDIYDPRRRRDVLAYVLGDVDNYQMSSYSSGATALGSVSSPLSPLRNLANHHRKKS